MHQFRLFRGKLEVLWINNGVGAAAIGVVLIAASLLVGPSWGVTSSNLQLCDSNSDTGSVSAAFRRLPPPYGETFFAEKLGLPFLSAYLDSIEPNFRHGANFGASGSTIQPTDAKLFGAGFNPLSLNIQLLQFEQFKDRTKEPFNQAKSSWIKNNLPRPKEFSKALYTLDCGQNDLHFGLSDQNGCIKSYNQLAQEFNKQLKDKVFQLRTQLHHAVLIYVDIYTAKYTLISEAEKQGFVSPLGYCCGHLGVAECWQTSIVNGTEVFAASCSDPSKHISWDGAHYTEAANKWVANHIVDGSLSDPPIPLTKSCHSADIPS
ncbi:gdsl esterase/lipase [Quercus suber]|uniref:Gdsl esterase/lipase n=1 Tax=Quercus suber TaxID=58331 RepID=A0AAW0KJL7_QUESU